MSATGSDTQPDAATSRPAVGELNHVAIGVRDLELSPRFYVDGRGLLSTLSAVA